MEYTVKDIPIYYETYGSGTPIVMIHGWSVDHHLMSGCLEPVFAGQDDTWQRIYLDLPGMGKTPARSWINGSDAMLEVVLGFIDGLLPGRHFLIAGESYGGYLARGVIKARRSLVDGMLFICSSVGQADREVPELCVLEKDEAFLNSLSEEDRRYFTGINVVQTPRVWELFKRDVLSGLKVADYDFLEHTLSQNVPYRVDVDRIEKPYDQPALFVMGRQDNSVGYRDHWRLIENFSRASFVILDKAGHNLQVEQDGLFHALAKEWLERVTGK
jgi:pimeloyl-ACP methyl ester carboxylesterase